MKILRVSKLLWDKDAVFQAKTTPNHYCWSPLERSGLETSCEVTIKLPKGECIVSKAQLERNDNLQNDLYIEHIANEVLLIQDNLETMKLKLQCKQLKKEINQRKRLPNLWILDSCWELYQLRRKFHKFLNWLKSIKCNIVM